MKSLVFRISLTVISVMILSFSNSIAQKTIEVEGEAIVSLGPEGFHFQIAILDDYTFDEYENKVNSESYLFELIAKEEGQIELLTKEGYAIELDEYYYSPSEEYEVKAYRILIKTPATLEKLIGKLNLHECYMGQIENIIFPDAKKEELYAQAVQDAKQMAESTLAVVGAHIVGVELITCGKVRENSPYDDYSFFGSYEALLGIEKIYTAKVTVVFSFK